MKKWEKEMKLRISPVVWLFLFAMGASSGALALDCSNAQTQTDMNHCAASDLDRETKKINKAYSDYRAKLNPAQKQQLKDVQLARIKFKDLACQFEASGVEGGSAQAMVLANCLADKTRQRSKEIEALGSCQEGDLSCPVR